MSIHIRWPKSRPDKIMYAYCDESSQTAHRYFAIGGIYFSPLDASRGSELCKRFEDELYTRKLEYGLKTSELKWGKVPTHGKFLDGYKRMIDFCLDSTKVGFRCMVVDTYKYSLHDPVFMKKDPELGFMKFLCVFLADGIMKKYEWSFGDVPEQSSAGVWVDSLHDSNPVPVTFTPGFHASF